MAQGTSAQVQLKRLLICHSKATNTWWSRRRKLSVVLCATPFSAPLGTKRQPLPLAASGGGRYLNSQQTCA